jgi:hypothetical protein
MMSPWDFAKALLMAAALEKGNGSRLWRLALS